MKILKGSVQDASDILNSVNITDASLDVGACHRLELLMSLLTEDCECRGIRKQQTHSSSEGQGSNGGPPSQWQTRSQQNRVDWQRRHETGSCQVVKT